mmetsp:Transcript_94289/g.206395  ORF Transcript_94289/g.206395 Transcript_94289/m.206395 type:complete len:214 (+) Transcript_94289:60-701(+)
MLNCWTQSRAKRSFVVAKVVRVVLWGEQSIKRIKSVHTTAEGFAALALVASSHTAWRSPRLRPISVGPSYASALLGDENVASRVAGLLTVRQNYAPSHNFTRTNCAVSSWLDLVMLGLLVALRTDRRISALLGTIPKWKQYHSTRTRTSSSSSNCSDPRAAVVPLHAPAELIRMSEMMETRRRHLQASTLLQQVLHQQQQQQQQQHWQQKHQQ